MKHYVLDTAKYYGYAVMGARDSGKSTWAEYAAERHYLKDWLICDWFDAGDFENLFWSVKKAAQYPILLIHPEYVTVNGVTGDIVKPIEDTVGLEIIMKTAIDEKRICCLSPGLYKGSDYWNTLARFLRKLPELNRDRLHHNIFVILREASNLAFSHIRTDKGQSVTRTSILNLMRVSRHFQLSFCFDAQRLGDIYKGIRTLIDRVIMKRTQPYTLPPELFWLHKMIEQKRWDLTEVAGLKTAAKYYPSLSHLYQDEFYCSWPDGYFAKLQNPMPTFRHKEPSDNFQAMTGITFDFQHKAETAVQSTVSKAQSTVSEAQLAIRLARKNRLNHIIQLREKGYTLKEIAERLKPPVSAQMVFKILKRATKPPLNEPQSPTAVGEAVQPLPTL